MLDRASGAGRTVLLLYLDFDGFKAINDQYGHHAGDKVLELFSAGAAEVLRRGDCFGRLGGDEFAVAMPVDAGQETQKLAEKLHERFSSTLQSSGYAVTCSMGALAVSPGTGALLVELMRKADQLMYTAKSAGKDGFRFGTVTLPATSSSPILAKPVGDAFEVPTGV